MLISNNFKIKKRIIILLCVGLILVGVIMYMFMHPTYYKYCDYWIIGKTLEQVEEKYGQFDLVESTRVGYYTHMEGGTRCYYWMSYADGLIYKVNMGCERGG